MALIKCKTCKEKKESILFEDSKMYKSGKNPICIQCAPRNKGKYTQKRLGGSYYQSVLLNEQFDLPKDNLCQECNENVKGYGFYPKIIKKRTRKYKKWVCYDCK